MSKRLTNEEFILRAKTVHGDKYTYENVSYEKMTTKVNITCPAHGNFQQRPNDHVSGGNGCPTCSIEKISAMKRGSAESFITKAKKIHGDKYYYDKVFYVNAITKVVITCSKHGDFEQCPDKHTSSGQGCPSCRLSHGERDLMNIFISRNIDFFPQKTFDDLRGSVKNTRLSYDFFLPEHNLLVEYDGQQHFEAVNIFGNIPNKEEQMKIFRETQHRDRLKNDYAINNGFKLLRMPYWERKNMEHILANALLANIQWS